MLKNKQVLMLGPDSQGGITSVIKTYLKSDLKNYITFLPTYKGKNQVFNVLYFLLFLIKYIFILMFNSNIKIVHIHFSYRGSFIRKSISLYIAKLFKKKTIFHLHSGGFNSFYNNSPKFFRNYITNTLKTANLVIVLAKFWESTINEICTGVNMKVIFNPVEIKIPCFQEKNNKIINVIDLGVFSEKKGTFDVVKAAEFLVDDNTVINLYGEGESEELKKTIIKHNLQDKVFVNGWISNEEKDTAYKNADILILPSYEECLPMSVLEAMAFGLPVIATPMGGVPEILEDGVNGFLITPGNFKDLAEKINILANDKELREKMGKAGYKTAKEKFNLDIISEKLISVYREL